MNKLFILKASLGVAATLLLPLAHATTLTKTDYDAGVTRISADYQAQIAACAPLAGNAKDVCVEEAKAVETVARAELEYRYTAKPSDQNKVLVAKAESAFDVATEKCDDKVGNDKDVCVKQAKAIEAKALADAQVGQVKTDAAADRRAADYTVAIEKCDALSGDAKTNCMAAAKANFGKSMSQVDYRAARETHIAARYKKEAAACDALAGNTKDVCVEEAKANERVANAELQYEFTGTASDHNKMMVAKAESGYAVAKEKCDDKAGNDKDVCVKQAEALQTKALADGKIAAAELDAAQAKRDADYNVAAEKCDALSGDAKSSCVAAAKAKFAPH
jgi:hypothetical protein